MGYFSPFLTTDAFHFCGHALSMIANWWRGRGLANWTLYVTLLSYNDCTQRGQKGPKFAVILNVWPLYEWKVWTNYVGKSGILRKHWILKKLFVAPSDSPLTWAHKSTRLYLSFPPLIYLKPKNISQSYRTTWKQTAWWLTIGWVSSRFDN